MKTIHSKAIWVALAVIFMAACSGGGSGPDFASPEEGVDADISSSATVDEKLAEQAGVERIVYHVGPVDLPANSKIEDVLEKPLSMKFQTDRAIWAVGFTPKVVDSNGKELPGELLHQAIMLNLHEENPLCAGSPNVFAVANSMLTEVELPKGYGYPILATDPLEVKAVLVNTSDKEYVDAYFEITLVARPMSEFATLSDVKPILLETDPCGHAPLDVPPNSFTEKSVTHQIPQAGNLVAANGLLQNFGAGLGLMANSETTPFWSADAIQNEFHSVTALTGNPFVDAEGISFKSGDKITLNVSYDNTSDKWLGGASAAALIYIAPK